MIQDIWILKLWYVWEKGNTAPTEISRYVFNQEHFENNWLLQYYICNNAQKLHFKSSFYENYKLLSTPTLNQ